MLSEAGLKLFHLNEKVKNLSLFRVNHLAVLDDESAEDFPIARAWLICLHGISFLRLTFIRGSPP
jgi:hypothetical protein